MSRWTDQLRQASFRGVPFEVDSASMSGGRRTNVHEIPNNDAAVGEDNGRRQRSVTFSAYVIGDDAIGQATALIAALEAGGPGLLVHPIHGAMNLWVDTYEQSDTWADGRAIMFELAFVELGDLEFLQVIDTGASLDSAITSLLDSVLASFRSLVSVDGYASFVADQLGSTLDGAFAAVDSVVRAGSAALSVVPTVLQDIADARETLETMTDAVASTAAGLLADVIGQLAEIGGLVALAVGAGTEYTAPVPATTARTQAARNAYEVERLQTRVAICEACRVMRDSELAVYDDAISQRDDLARLLAEESTTTDDGDVYDAMRALRVALVEDVTRRAALLPRVTTYTPAAASPAVTLAWELYSDGDRGDEIATRNAVVHPLFVPAEALSVLAE